MKYYTTSVKSTKRNTNEDNYITLQQNHTYVFGVSDGIGGFSYADIASTLAIDQFKNKKPISSIEPIFKQANQIVLEESKKRKKQMGTTLAACIFNQETGEIQIGHVGDSRVYIITEHIWHTKDHTLVQELVDMGIIDDTQAFTHPEKHRMNKALGINEKINPDIHTDIIKEATILLTTDGLHDYVNNKRIKEIISKKSMKKAAELLIDEARSHGSTDDITIIIATLTS